MSMWSGCTVRTCLLGSFCSSYFLDLCYRKIFDQCYVYFCILKHKLYYMFFKNCKYFRLSSGEEVLSCIETKVHQGFLCWRSHFSSLVGLYQDFIDQLKRVCGKVCYPFYVGLFFSLINFFRNVEVKRAGCVLQQN